MQRVSAIQCLYSAKSRNNPRDIEKIISRPLFYTPRAVLNAPRVVDFLRLQPANLDNTRARAGRSASSRVIAAIASLRYEFHTCTRKFNFNLEIHQMILSYAFHYADEISD